MHVPSWTHNSLQLNFNHKHNIRGPHSANKDPPDTTNSTDSNNKNIYIVVPYIRGISETFKNTCNKAGIQVYFKGHNIILTLFVAPKDQGNMCQKSGVIHHYKCSHKDCPEQGIGGSDRAFGDTSREHLRAPSPIHLHSQTTGHQVDLDCFNIIDREAQGATRTIKEAMYIWVNNPSLNRNLGKFNLSHFWDEVIQDTPSLQIM